MKWKLHQCATKKLNWGGLVFLYVGKAVSYPQSINKERKSHTKSTTCPFCGHPMQLLNFSALTNPHKYCRKAMVQNPNHSLKSLAFFFSSLWPLMFHLVQYYYYSVRSRQSGTEKSPNYEKVYLASNPFTVALKTTICYELLTSGKSWESVGETNLDLLILNVQWGHLLFGSFVGFDLSQCFSIFSFMVQCVLLTVGAYDSLKHPIFIFIIYMWHHKPFIFILCWDKYSVTHGSQ